MIASYTVSRDDTVYEAFPDIALTRTGKLVCVFAECTHHNDRSYTRILKTVSNDRGRTWESRQPVTEATNGLPFYNCPRVSTLPDGRLALLVDQLHAPERSSKPDECRNLLYMSADEGSTWTPPVETPALGIVPDRLCVLPNGRWIVSCHYCDTALGYLVQRLWYSDDEGNSWSDPVIVGRQEGLNLCEASILPVDERTLVAFMRENTGTGRDCWKTISRDGGENWSEPVRFPLPACHRPVAGFLRDGSILITFRFMQGGKGGKGRWTQNLFAALTDTESALALTRAGAWTRIRPLDFDRSAESDTGYSGWIQFEDGEIYVVNYTMDDAPKAQIRGYSLSREDFLL